MAEKVTTMVLKVDLQCPCCYKKTKKILCKFPQIRNQVYDEKGNTVTITVVCCSPEKIRDKLCSKGGKVIKSIEIKEPPKPKETEKKKESDKTKEPEKKKESDKTKEPEKKKESDKTKEPEKKKESDKTKEPKKDEVVVAEKPKSNGKGSDAPAAAEKTKVPIPKDPEPNPPPPGPVKVDVPVKGFPSVFPTMPSCGPSYNDGYGGWPCYHGYGVPPPPQPCYDGYYGYDQYGRAYHVVRCDSYFSEENPSACLIM